MLRFTGSMTCSWRWYSCRLWIAGVGRGRQRRQASRSSSACGWEGIEGIPVRGMTNCGMSQSRTEMSREIQRAHERCRRTGRGWGLRHLLHSETRDALARPCCGPISRSPAALRVSADVLSPSSTQAWRTEGDLTHLSSDLALIKRLRRPSQSRRYQRCGIRSRWARRAHRRPGLPPLTVLSAHHSADIDMA